MIPIYLWKRVGRRYGDIFVDRTLEEDPPKRCRVKDWLVRNKEGDARLFHFLFSAAPAGSLEFRSGASLGSDQGRFAWQVSSRPGAIRAIYPPLLFYPALINWSNSISEQESGICCPSFALFPPGGNRFDPAPAASELDPGQYLRVLPVDEKSVKITKN